MKITKQSVWVAMLSIPLMLAGCGTSKTVTTNKPGTTTTTTTTTATTKENKVDNAKAESIAMLKKVVANSSNADNLVSSIDFNIKSGSRDITVDGKMYMRRNQVIRIQLSPMGLVEVGRLEFTPDSVLIIDRLHKQFVKSGYDKVSFLKDNGIDFYALQSLFWNQLYIPGQTDVVSASEKYQVTGNSTIAMRQGKINYLWTTDAQAFINKVVATYESAKQGKSSLNWAYSNFKPFNGKQFPSLQNIDLSTGSRKIHVGIDLKNMKDDSKWEPFTKVSSKYKQVELKDVMNQIMNLQ